MADGVAVSRMATNDRHSEVGRVGGAIERLLQLGVVAVLAVIGIWAYQVGAGDFRYQLADLKEDPLYLRGPGWRIASWIVFSLLVWGGVSLAGLFRRRLRPKVAPTPGRMRWRWWWLLVAAWAGYAAGGAVAVAEGGPVLRPGTLRLEIGAPLAASLETSATCKTVPGKPAVVASIVAQDDRLPSLQVLDGVTGARRGDGLAFIDVAWTGWKQPIAIPGIPDRPPIYQIVQNGRLAIGATLIEAETIPFLRAYGYQPVDNQVSGGSGTAHFLALRGRVSRYRDLIVNDPWPDSYELTVRWTCDLGATAPVIAPTPLPTPPFVAPEPSQTPTPVPPAGVPVTIQLTSGSELLSVGVEGATVASVEKPIVTGDAGASYADGTFRLEQALEAAIAGRVVDATFRFVLRDATAGTMILLPITHGTVGPFAVTVYNDLGADPVPVCASTGDWQWPTKSRPHECLPLAAWLVGPVRWVAVP